MPDKMPDKNSEFAKIQGENGSFSIIRKKL